MEIRLKKTTPASLVLIDKKTESTVKPRIKSISK